MKVSAVVMWCQYDLHYMTCVLAVERLLRKDPEFQKKVLSMAKMLQSGN